MSHYMMNPPRRCPKTGLPCSCAPKEACSYTPNPYEARPFFTQPHRDIKPSEYHNTSFPPITSEAIQEAAKRLRELRAQWDEEDTEILASLPVREPLPPRILDLNPDDSRDDDTLRRYTEAAAKVNAVPFFPDGAIGAVLHALHKCGISRKDVRVERDDARGLVLAYLTGIGESYTEIIREHALGSFPAGVGLEVFVDHGPDCGCDDCEEERNR